MKNSKGGHWGNSWWWPKTILTSLIWVASHLHPRLWRLFCPELKGAIVTTVIEVTEDDLDDGGHLGLIGSFSTKMAKDHLIWAHYRVVPQRWMKIWQKLETVSACLGNAWQYFKYLPLSNQALWRWMIVQGPRLIIAIIITIMNSGPLGNQCCNLTNPICSLCLPTWILNIITVMMLMWKASYHHQNELWCWWSSWEIW